MSMRKCVIHTRVVQGNNTLTAPVLLEPFVHAALYKIPPIKAACKFLADNDFAEMVAIRIDNRCYTVTVITDNQPELVANAFDLDGGEL